MKMGAESAPAQIRAEKVWGQKAPSKHENGGKKRPQNHKVGAESAPAQIRAEVVI